MTWPLENVTGDDIRRALESASALLFAGHVRSYTRRSKKGRPGVVREYETKRQRKTSMSAQVKSYLAKEYYRATSGEKADIGAEQARAFAAASKGKATPDNHPFDVVHPDFLAEVKTVHPGAKNPRVTMHGAYYDKKRGRWMADSLARKKAWSAKSGRGRPVFTVVVDFMSGYGRPKYYWKAGVGNYWMRDPKTGRDRMKREGSLKDVVRALAHAPGLRYMKSRGA